MSLTDDGHAEIRRFFEEELLPAAERRRREGRAAFPSGPAPEALSYFKARRRPSMAPADFEQAGIETPEALSTALTDLWRGRGDADLAALAPGVARLAELLRRREEQTDDVSPFIYVMF